MIPATLSVTTTELPEPTRTLLLTGQDPEVKRREILTYFCQTFDLYDSLFDCLADPRAWFSKAISLRHPLIFYYGHTAAFFINKLLAARLIERRIDADIEAMVAIGVDEMSWDDLDETHYDWPRVEALRSYRGKVRARVIDVINQMPITLPIDWQSPAWVILMGIEHERIHLETSSVLIRQLPLDWVRSQPYWPTCQRARHRLSEVPDNSLLPITGGQITLGKRDDTYGWDNEYGTRSLDIEAFQASRLLVSNGEYLAFVQDGGYQTQTWWDQEGWGWRQYAGAQMPSFWLGELASPDQLQLRLMTEVVAMPWDWPVEVNQLEAAAFCRWKSAKTGLPIQLPSEAQWARLREQLAGDQPDWHRAPGNINLAGFASPCPVDMFPQGEFCDLVGNVWQWTGTAIDGFEGFQVHPLYDDFSTPTFDGKHTLIKGGSWISTGNEALKSARYAFRRHFFQHAGFRYLVSRYQEPVIVNPYETDALVAQYLDFQYGPSHFGVANYAKTLADIASELCNNRQRALDIGCATGRASFELARHFQHVDGVDYSARFIDVALSLAKQDSFRYALSQEGDLVQYCEARLTEHDLGPAQAARIHFSQGDACNLKPKYDHYDLVLASNLIDRLREPARFLRDISPRLRSGGLLMLTSPYTWLEEYTPKANWLGGVRENGEALSTHQALQRLLAAEFEELCEPRDIPFVIRETARKHQHTLAQLTIWRKR
ncbi:5-histidylcysteine sulfoxide synthase [Aeromonas sp. BIGb0445]|uniref:5-histidylcysteine sulfoxide synthase n=1 Tax=Aeromonas sp. BIGb0445 TaxID=2940593 RepID=UPI0021696689|nr:5-histidylcysteine sulfoxide synthase [Aeromonas sp. BIGb0445]MCS3460680.1 5-histidylcysteine sulfoxide synthase/putative 4-mercaptohistidine N1-methyltransferase [Aeromonas sp. BIGb0445]